MRALPERDERRGRGAERMTTRVEVRGRLTRVTVEVCGLSKAQREAVVRGLVAGARVASELRGPTER